MEKEIEEAFLILDSTSTADPAKYQAAFSFYETLLSTPNALQPCLSLFRNASVATRSYKCKFFCLQVIEVQLQRQLHSGEFFVQIARSIIIPEIRHIMLELSADDRSKVPFFYKSKLATAAVRIFRQTYLSVWTDAVKDFLVVTKECADAGCGGDDFFLLLCTVIDEEVVSLAISRPDYEILHNTNIKDRMREGDLELMFERWILILGSSFSSKNYPTVENALRVISRYAGWIDVGFLTRERFVFLLTHILNAKPTDFSSRSSHSSQYEQNAFSQGQLSQNAFSQQSVNSSSSSYLSVLQSAIECYTAIISKGMPASSKFSLLSKFNSFEMIQILFKNLFVVGEKEEKTAFITVLNSVGVEIVCCLAEVNDERDVYLQRLEVLFGDCLTVYENVADFEMLSGLTCFFSDAVSLTKTIPKRFSIPIASSLISLCQRALVALIRRLGFPNEFDFDDEPGDFENDFLEFRTALTIILLNVYPIVQDSYQNCVRQFVLSAFNSFQQIDVAVYLIFLHAEVTKCIPERVSRGPFPAELDELLLMMFSMFPSSLLKESPGKYLVVFETIARYSQYGFFSLHPQLLYAAVELFSCAFASSSEFVKAKVIYLMNKFLKVQKETVTADKKLCEIFITGLIPYLQVIPTESEEAFGSIGLLFECAGILLNGTEKCELILKQIFESIYQQSSTFNSQPAYFSNAFLAVGQLAKGLPECSDKCGDEIQGVLADFCQFLLKTLVQFSSQPSVRASAIFLIQRLALVLGSSVLHVLPPFLSTVLNFGSIVELSEILSVLSSIAHRLSDKVVECYALFLDSLLAKIFFEFLHFKPTGTDDEISLAALKKAYISFCCTLFTAGIGGKLLSVSCLQEQTFGTFLNSIGVFCEDSTDRALQKSSFNLMTRSINCWMSAAETSAEPGWFDRFVTSRYFPCIFNVITSSQLDCSDGQVSLLLGEISGAIKAAYLKNTQPTELFIRQLSELNQTDRENVDILMEALKESPHQFKNAFVKFVKQLHR